MADPSFDLFNDDFTGDEFKKYGNMLQRLMEKLHHDTELRLATSCIQVLSTLEVRGLPCSLLECKCLTLDMHIEKWDLPGIAKLLEISPYLETLVISIGTLQPDKFHFSEDFDNAYRSIAKNYFQS